MSADSLKSRLKDSVFRGRSHISACWWCWASLLVEIHSFIGIHFRSSTPPHRRASSRCHFKARMSPDIRRMLRSGQIDCFLPTTISNFQRRQLSFPTSCAEAEALRRDIPQLRASIAARIASWFAPVVSLILTTPDGAVTATPVFDLPEVWKGRGVEQSRVVPAVTSSHSMSFRCVWVV